VHYFLILPEVAGGLGKNSEMSRDTHPPVVLRLHYEFDVWLGDDLLESFPCFIATRRLAESIAEHRLTGVSYGEVEVSRSGEFEDLYPNRVLPEFVWLRISGRAGEDDFGTDAMARLVVSEQVLELLKTVNFNHGNVTPFG
jgi:hypothetical protein